jgi:RNA polymerase sigma-70 factor (ECF subfamily)
MMQSRVADLTAIVARHRAGDIRARDELISIVHERLFRLTRKMLKEFPSVHRWEDTDDVFQNACLRLHRSMEEVTFATVTDLFRFASATIRRELIDLSRHYNGPQGYGTHQAKQSLRTDSFSTDRVNPASDTHDPHLVQLWTEFHQLVEQLAAPEREMFDLLWYQELTQAEAAELLGVSERTVQRRWLSARMQLQEVLQLASDASTKRA